MVYAMLVESNAVDDPARFKETELYRQCVAAGVVPADEADLARIQNEQRQADAADMPSIEAAAEPDNAATTLALDLVVDGMWCTACAWVIEKSVSRLAGVQQARCHFSTDRLHCRYRPEQQAPDQIRKVIKRLGYDTREANASDGFRQSQHQALVRLIISALLSANVMMLSWALYAGFFTDLSSDAIFKISLPIAVMASVVFFYGGASVLRRAWFGLIRGAPGMESLVGLGAGCAYAYSLFNYATGSIHLYFDTACMLITLVLLGKLLEQQAKARVRRDLDSFFALQPAKVRLIGRRFPAGRYASIDQLASGDHFCVETDEIVPADGRVVSGRATVDESSLTGEPRPVTIKTADPIKSGTRVLDGRVIAAAETVGENTILGQMIAIMTRSLEQKSVFEGRTDRMLRWFVPSILILAAGTALSCWLAGLSVDRAVVRAVTVMVISCPCALGVAIPMARLAGISLAGRQGILIREIEAFERATAIDSLVFDKTGTLTLGRWQLNRIECKTGYDADTVLAWASGLEQASDHEIAHAIRSYAQQKCVRPATVADVSFHPGGVQGRVDNRWVRVGNREFAWREATSADAPEKDVDGVLTSRVFVSMDDCPAAVLFFGDSIRPSVPSLMTTLKRAFREIHLVSGDGDATTRTVGRSLGLKDVRGGLMPADKADYIQRLNRRGRLVAMVGDGVNDAAAMARAHLSAAVHSGQGLAKEAAHITLMRGDPAQLSDFFPLSRQVNRKVIQNLWCAWIYNLISIPVAMSGLLTPLVAATAMLLSSLTVIGNTLLLVRRHS